MPSVSQRSSVRGLRPSSLASSCFERNSDKSEWGPDKFASCEPSLAQEATFPWGKKREIFDGFFTSRRTETGFQNAGYIDAPPRVSRF
jgi:hypothetical protein